jgi:regulation of enolase protein 1 (concanavalin A-like superfamily)
MGPASQLPFYTLNTPTTAKPPPATSTSFTLSPGPATPTDIWRKPGPPEVKTFNAPVIYKSLKVNSFQRARVTVSANWSTLFDQGGLTFILPAAGIEPTDRKWIKTGIEFYQGEPFVSTVAADAWADWSLVQAGIHDGEVTIEMERKAKDDTLWIYVIDGQNKIPIREVTWALSEPGTDVCWIGVYAATPTTAREGTVNNSLNVKFEGWELETRD